MALQQPTIDELGQTMVEGYSSQATIPADSDTGSQIQAILNAPKLPLGLLMQQILYTYNIARLSTIPANSDGTVSDDVASFCSPFGIIPLGKAAATGQVTFTTLSPVSAALLIPVGVIVQTPGGTQFTVTDGGTGYDSSAKGYWIAAAGTSVTVPVTCSTAGSIGNVQASTITQIYSGIGAGPPIAGNPTVTNQAKFTNGSDGEIQSAFISRFTKAMSTGVVSTKNAIAAAILGTQNNLTYSLADGLDANGNAKAANFTVVVNTIAATSGASSTLLNSVQSSVDAVRSAGITFSVISPTMVPVNVTATVKTGSGYVSGSVESAVQAYLGSIGLDPGGASTVCALGKIYSVIYGVTGVLQVDTVQLNSGTADITAAFAHMIMAGTVSFTFTS